MVGPVRVQPTPALPCPDSACPGFKLVLMRRLHPSCTWCGAHYQYRVSNIEMRTEVRVFAGALPCSLTTFGLSRPSTVDHVCSKMGVAVGNRHPVH